jgi:uncharacterized protein YdiU (UPF0061 family)
MINSLADLAPLANYSLMDGLTPDPQARVDGVDHQPREVFSGHYVPVNPKPLKDPHYVCHSQSLFEDLGFADELAQSEEFLAMFSGDLSQVPDPLRKVGWATGYALSIYGTEYYQQCPFQTGNGYGDGRAISILEGVFNGKRLEMQLKGGGPTPYCRGADGRAVLRSSVREFLAQEHMHALGVPTSRSLSLYVSGSERVKRPWFSVGSTSRDPDVYVTELAAITTRVASSFLRVGQIELFGRRARKMEHPWALHELEMILLHLIEREYKDSIDESLPLNDKLIQLCQMFMDRLTTLVSEWIRVGYCQGNFNSDNCAAGGFTLDYGPFGFIEAYHPHFQPWTGGGHHFAFMNQPVAAQRNFLMFTQSLSPLLASSPDHLSQLNQVEECFAALMQEKMDQMWTKKLGLKKFDSNLFKELEQLMSQTPVDYTIFFRALSHLPETIKGIEKSFYRPVDSDLSERWSQWLSLWRARLEGSLVEVSQSMKSVNPKYTLREWFLVPAYQKAAEGDYTLLRELNEVMTRPYDEQDNEKYDRLKPLELFRVAGVSHVSCSS